VFQQAGPNKGKPCKNILCLNFRVLLAKDLKGSVGIPALVSFRSTGFIVGKQLTTMIAKGAFFGKAPHDFRYSLGCVERTNDLGTFFVWDVQKLGTTTQSQKEAAEFWLTEGRLQEIQVDTEEDAEQVDSSQDKY